MKADLLRKKFLDFFKAKKHKVVESETLVPKDDPTVLFTPAGMSQFKRQFLGEISDFRRAASAQRCLRTDDLGKVGHTSCHHTFFEMLGNFSFGDYFKKEAIAWAWEFLVKELKISEEKLWISVYKDDDEAYDIWKDKIKIPSERIVRLGDKENFWPSEAKEKGPNGPCGPCSEIFFDFGKDKGCGEPVCDPSCSCGRFTEIWNLVFTQFNRKEGGILEPLPQKNIDTGMGLERLAAVTQGASNNFQTELFKPVIKEIESVISRQSSVVSKELVYAIADHVRAVTFAIYDGVLPSNDGRGYVIRKMIRKSILHLSTLGIDKPFLYKFAPVVAEIMSEPYPELSRRREGISQVILAEEKNFIRTLKSSDELLKEKFNRVLKSKDAEEAGKITFQLYDTYGIPAELTREWLKKNNLEFSQVAFNQAMEEQKKRSKATSSMKGDVFSALELKLDLPKTKFFGYKNDKCAAKILKIIKDNQEVKKASQGESVKVILDKTVFYGQSGGQLGDKGRLTKGKSIFEVSDTQKIGKVIAHSGTVKKGSFKKSDELTAEIDSQHRLAIARNHTATHLLQAALRQVLGPHVQQQGSLVAEDRLRFDFTHFKGLSKEELDRAEEIVNDFIINNYALSVKEMPLSSAKKQGALAFFAEKYEEKVRLVSIGDFSKELCAGTHLASTGFIGYFKIIHEGSVASGVRRIEAVTGKGAFKAVKEQEKNFSDGLKKKTAQLKELEKRLNSRKQDLAKTAVSGAPDTAEIINGIKVIAKVLPDSDMAALRGAMDTLKMKNNNTAIALGAASSGRALLVVGLTDDLAGKGLDASKLIAQAAQAIGGSGGGRKDFAQAGGTKPEGLPAAFEKLKEILRGLK